jgi:hypothetical protein
MRYVHSTCVALALAVLMVGPALALPRLSLHTPTLTPVSSHTPAAPQPGDALRVAPLLGMGIKVKDTGAIAAKFKQRASGAAQDYAAGVQGAGGDWEAGARAGESNYEQGVQDAIGRKAFGKGVSAAGSAKYVENATKLGTQRYPQGVANAEGAYARGAQPYLDTIKSLTLPPRGPKGSAQNQTRADAVAKALRMVKTGR